MGYKVCMAWKETCVMNERVKLIGDFLSGEWSISELALEYGVSRKTVYKWVDRYKCGGSEALEDRSRAAHVHPNQVSAEVERRVLELKAARPLWGAPKLRTKLLQALGNDLCPAESTISAILQRNGLSRIVRRRRRATPSESPLSHCQTANEVWCADFKGWFETKDGRRCTPLTISDGHSRYLLKCQGLADHTGFVAVQPVFIQTFREFGLPQAIRTDNGPPFATLALGGLSALSVWWIRLGIRPERIEPGCPQQNGRHERMHRTLNEATAKPPRKNLSIQQKAFEDFRREYNEERPHEALGQQPPAVFYEPSLISYPERLPKQRGYPDDWEKRMVRKGGQMKWKGHDVRITDALWGQEIGLKPIGEAAWAVYFEEFEIGLFDEITLRVHPVKRLCFGFEEKGEPEKV
jgi:putative transposase